MPQAALTKASGNLGKCGCCSCDRQKANFLNMEINEKDQNQIRKWAMGMKTQFTEKGNTDDF